MTLNQYLGLVKDRTSTIEVFDEDMNQVAIVNCLDELITIRLDDDQQSIIIKSDGSVLAKDKNHNDYLLYFYEKKLINLYNDIDFL
jgi:hypothetical protein